MVAAVEFGLRFLRFSDFDHLSSWICARGVKYFQVGLCAQENLHDLSPCCGSGCRLLKKQHTDQMTWDFVPPPPPPRSSHSLCGGGDNDDDVDDVDDDDDDGDIVSVEVVSKKGKLAKEGGSRQCWRGLRGTGEVIRDTLNFAQLGLCLSILSLYLSLYSHFVVGKAGHSRSSAAC